MSEAPAVSSSGRRRARLRDVAEAAGVDPSVVSRVLSGDGRLSIRPETRQRVLEAAARLEYRPNRAAQTLKTARTMAIGMVVPDLANPAFALIAEGAERCGADAGYALVLIRRAEGDRLDDLVGRVDGLLVAAATSDVSYRRELFGGLPAVLVNRREPGEIPSVVVDDEGGSALAVRHLLSLGHRRIAHVAGPQTADTARRRLAGWRFALAEAGLEPAQDAVIEASAFDEAAADRAAEALLAGPARPTALFAANIRLATGTLSAAHRLGLEVPRDVSIVGFDDHPLAAYLHPPLTTVRMPLVELGAAAVESLLDEIDGRRAESRLVDTPAELVLRASTANPGPA
jgi:LacI family transcriptional regulator, galactose operon repressor